MRALKWLKEVEERAWRGYRRLFTLLEARLARDLADDRGLSAADYTVLSNLAEAKGRRWRLSGLAKRMQWTQSRLSHQLTRMEKRGLVRRAEVAADGRGAFAVLTRRGLRTIAAASPGHMAAVREHFIDLLTEEQLRTLGDIAETAVRHLTTPEADDEQQNKASSWSLRSQSSPPRADG